MSTPRLTDEQRQAFLNELAALSVRHGIAIRGHDYFLMISLEPVYGTELRYDQTDDFNGEPVYVLHGDIPFPLTEAEIAAEKAAREAVEARAAAVREAKIAAGYTWDERDCAWRDQDGSL